LNHFFVHSACLLGCPKRVFIKNNQNVTLCGKVSENVLLCTANSFHMEGFHNLGDLSIRIKSPSDQEFVPKAVQTKSDECRIEWTPYELGTYTITAHYCDHVVKVNKSGLFLLEGGSFFC